MTQRRSLFLLLALLLCIAAIWSIVAITAPHGSTLDQRTQDVASQLKCLVCQSESVADSPSELAQQMRGVIRQQLQDGRSEQQVIDYFVSRYGERIIWSPPWQGFTLLAWLVPIGLLLSGVVLVFFVLRDWSRAPQMSAKMSDELEPDDLNNIPEAELAQYRAQIEQELAISDPIFARTQPRTEAD